MTSIRSLKNVALLFEDPLIQRLTAKHPTIETDRLENLARNSERNDIIQAAHKQRADALDEIGQVAKIIDKLEATADGVLVADPKKQLKYFQELDRSADGLKAAVEKWQAGTKTLIDMDVLSATSEQVAKDALNIAKTTNRIFDQAANLAKNFVDKTDKDSLVGKLSRNAYRNITEVAISTSYSMDDFMRTVLKRNPADVRAGRFSIIV